MGCPWWAWAVIAGLGLCLLVVGLHGIVELARWRHLGGWEP